MWGNWINRHDFIRLWEKTGTGAILPFLKKIFHSSEKRTLLSWNRTSSPPTHFWGIPFLVRVWNQRISGDPGTTMQNYIAEKYLEGKSSLTALSIGCGTGSNELKWAGTGRFKRIEAFDLSPPLINTARERAKSSGFNSILHFFTGDALSVLARERPFDLITAEGSFHHLQPVEELLVCIRDKLTPNGLFIIKDFVGPSRFQWSDRQLAITNRLLESLPESHRRIWPGERIKKKVYRPGKLRMILSDPSEAVQSSKIRPALEKTFRVLESKELGGTILALLFAEIGHHFQNEDPHTLQLLRNAVETEELSMESGEITSDYFFAVCERPDKTVSYTPSTDSRAARISDPPPESIDQ